MVCWNPTFLSSFLVLSLLSAATTGAAAVSCRLYHTVPKALKLSTLWQPHGTTAVAQQVCVDVMECAIRL